MAGHPAGPQASPADERQRGGSVGVGAGVLVALLVLLAGGKERVEVALGVEVAIPDEREHLSAAFVRGVGECVGLSEPEVLVGGFLDDRGVVEGLGLGFGYRLTGAGGLPQCDALFVTVAVEGGVGGRPAFAEEAPHRKPS